MTLSDGQLIYAPSSDVHGPASFTYTVSDGQLSTVATVNGTVTAVNDAPVAVDDSFTVEEDGRTTIDVLANDYDVDGGPLVVVSVNGQPILEGGMALPVVNGSVALVDGKLVFSASPNAAGESTFTYTLSGGAQTSIATVNGFIKASEPIIASVDTTLDPNGKTLILTGTAPLAATGNALNNVIVGNDGSNFINGGAGDDMLAGGRGDDVYIIDSQNDIVRERPSEGSDEVRSTVSFALPEHTEKLTLLGIGHLSGTGNELANLITGNTGHNVIMAGGGNDVVVGGGGNDTIAGESGNDTLSGQDGNDTIYGNSGVDLINGGAGADILDGGDGNDGIYGGGGNDRISGGHGDDKIFGDGGNDILRGGTGSDTLTGDKEVTPSFGHETT